MDHSVDLHSALELQEGVLRLPSGRLPCGSFAYLEAARRGLSFWFEIAPVRGQEDLAMAPHVLVMQLLDAMPTDCEPPYVLGEFMKYSRERESCIFSKIHYRERVGERGM